MAATRLVSVGAVEGLVTGTVPFSAVDGTGNRFVVFLQGCNWDCLTCHNPATIPHHPKGMAPVRVADVLAPIVDAAPFLTGVTVTGGEPTQQPEFLTALLTALAEHPATSHLSRYVDIPVYVHPMVPRSYDLRPQEGGRNAGHGRCRRRGA